MDLLKWKTANVRSVKIYYAAGCICRWDIQYSKEHNGFRVLFPIGDPKSLIWEWRTFDSLLAAQRQCELRNRDIFMTMFTKKEKIVLDKFFEKLHEFDEAYGINFFIH